MTLLLPTISSPAVPQAAFAADATVESILKAGVDFLPPRSAAVMRGAIAAALQLAREIGEYRTFGNVVDLVHGSLASGQVR